MSFQISDLLLFPAIVQGFFIASFLLSTKKGNPKANGYMAFFMLSSAFMLVGRMIYARFPEGWMVQIALVPDLVIFLFGPLTYFFISALFYKKPIVKKWLHFVPFLTYTLIILYFFTLGASFFDQFAKTRDIWVMFFVVETLGLISNFTYTIICIHLILKYRNKEKNLISYQQPAVKFVSIFLFSIIACEILWLASYTSINFFKQALPLINYSSIWFSMPFVSYIVGYYMLAKPQVLQFEYVTEKKSTMRVHSAGIDQLKTKLHNAIVDAKIYQKDSLTLKELADQIDTSPNNLSWLLNDVYDQSFYDFINASRIQAFIEKIENDEHIKKTILSLALEVGFKSKSTFNKAFKSIYDTTPSQYIKHHYPQKEIAFKYSA